MTDQGSAHGELAVRKAELRRAVIAQRAAMGEAEREAARQAIMHSVLAICPPHGTIAAYLALRTEPGSLQLLHLLSTAGHEVLVPITQADRDLDWCVWRPVHPLPGSPGEWPAGPALGRDAVARAVLVLVPAFAVDHAGHRLGRGGGSYDRALLRVDPEATTAALLFRGELRAEVPAGPWDVDVRAVVTPDGFMPTPIRQRNT